MRVDHTGKSYGRSKARRGPATRRTYLKRKAMVNLTFRGRDDVDLKAGRIRRTRACSVVTVHRTVTDTVLTKALPESVRVRGQPEWVV